jgi:hypothetical protein
MLWIHSRSVCTTVPCSVVPIALPISSCISSGFPSITYVHHKVLSFNTQFIISLHGDHIKRRIHTLPYLTVSMKPPLLMYPRLFVWDAVVSSKFSYVSELVSSLLTTFFLAALIFPVGAILLSCLDSIQLKSCDLVSWFPSNYVILCVPWSTKLGTMWSGPQGLPSTLLVQNVVWCPWQFMSTMHVHSN